MGDMAFVPEPGTWHWCLRAPPHPPPPAMTNAAGLDHPCPFGPHSLLSSCVPALSLVSWRPFLSVPGPAQDSSLYVHIHLFSLCFSVSLFWRSLGPAHNAVGMGVKGAQVPLPHSTH